MKWAFVFLFAGVVTHAADSDARLRQNATRALERACAFFRDEVAIHGTYLWQYSEDLAQREGEGKATRTQGWVQPPGTPAVGMAFLSAWQSTSNRLFLEAAQETARGLIQGQLRSGGWHYAIDFDPEARRKVAYLDGGGTGRVRNVTTFDDDTTQSAVRFLARLDAALSFRDAKVGSAVEYALDAILKAQYPNGSWPQGYEQFPDSAQFPVKKASYPKEWSRTWPGSQQYWLRYTLNDNALATIVDTLLELGDTYAAPQAGANRKPRAVRARAAAQKAGDFLLLAQMPDPQPAWAQQYDFEMHPSWARKFEPPSITAGESQGALRMLLKLYRETGEQKFLKPLPQALAYLRRSRLPDGRLARFYELRSNKALYFTKEYALTYDNTDLPTHYGFVVSDNTEAIEREYELVKNLGPEGLKRRSAPKRSSPESLRAEVRAVIAAQDESGRWVEDGRLRHHGPDDSTRRVIRTATFIRNVETLSRFLNGTEP